MYPKVRRRNIRAISIGTMAGRCCVKRGSIAFAKSQLTMIGLLFASGASSSSSSPSSSHGNHATKWHLVTRLLGLPHFWGTLSNYSLLSKERSILPASPSITKYAKFPEPQCCCKCDTMRRACSSVSPGASAVEASGDDPANALREQVCRPKRFVQRLASSAAEVLGHGWRKYIV